MILINLLPPSQRNLIRNQKIKSYANSVAVLIFILACGILGAIFLAKILLAKNLSALEKQINQTNQEISQQDKEKKMLQDYNVSLGLASKFAEKQVPWTETLTEIARSTPSDVQITNLTADLTKSSKMTLKGKAASRRSVVKLAEKLESSDSFSQTKFVSSEKGDEAGKVDFEITLNLDKLAKLVQPTAPTNTPAQNTSSKSPAATE